jgi:hypothetical protein
MEEHELEAYGLCGLTPQTFGDLTLPEFDSMVEAAYWREGRWLKVVAQMVAQLLRPHLERGTNVSFLANDLAGGDPVAQVEQARARRLKIRRESMEPTE